MNILTLDFETYYDKEYSLKRMTTEAYIRDPRFEVIGVGAKLNNELTKWYCASIEGFLNTIDFSNTAILAHNTMFDGAILAWKYGIKPKLWLDTMLMSRPIVGQTIGGALRNLAEHYNIGVKGTEVVKAIGKRFPDFTPEELANYSSYCINDVKLTYKLFKKLIEDFPASELRVIDQTIRMYTEPCVELNKKALTTHLAAVKTNKAQLVDRITPKSMGPEEVKDILMSNDKFAKLLQGCDVTPPTKVSPANGKQTYAFAKTDKGFLDIMQNGSSLVQAICEARLGVRSTLEETRTENLIGVAGRGKLPIMLNYYGAHTGRFSGGDKLNLQNLPRNGTIRKAITVPKGYKLIACDSSQIEARVLAHLAGQDDLVEAFRQGRDVYSEFASTVYGRTITKNDKLERFVGKTCILGLGYGMGAEKFQATLGLGMGGIKVDIDMNEARRIVYLYRNKNHRIQALWQKSQSVLSDLIAGRAGNISSYVTYNKSGIQLPNGLAIQYPSLCSTNNEFKYWSKPKWTYIYGGKVVENIVQALARIVVAEQMTAIGRVHHVAFQVHDEIIIYVRDEEATNAQQLIEKIMSTPPCWARDLPVACESGVGNNYGDAK